MIRDCIHSGHEGSCGAVPDPVSGLVSRHGDGCEWDAGDWERFERHAIDSRAEGEDLMGVVETVMEAITARPTSPPSGSSRQGAKSSPKSKGALPRRGSIVPDQATDL